MEPTPPPVTETMTERVIVVMTPSFKAAVDREARKRGQSTGAFIRGAVTQRLNAAQAAELDAAFHMEGVPE